MKIKCPYCDAMINDTLELCPHCGGPNPNVKRTANDTPQTIEDLKKWYDSHGLPPAETTRFFIGIDYKKPRAFGIYKEEATGNFVVYKNKDTGERAIRYKGTDEAYAVNELYMRLKQEILEQKKHNLSKSSSGNNNSNSYSPWNSILKPFLLVFGAGIVMLILLCIGVSIFDDSPSKGYYSYNNKGYYYLSTDGKWFDIDSDTGEWNSKSISIFDVPSELEKKKTAKNYYLCFDWKDDINLPNFDNSVYMQDKTNPAQNGYYKYNNTEYYNLTGSYDNGWYYYDDNYDEWSPVTYSDVPDDLKHYSTSKDFYYTSEWDSSITAKNFTDSKAYENYEASQQESNSSSSDDGYDWGSSDSWDSGSSDFSSDWKPYPLPR